MTNNNLEKKLKEFISAIKETKEYRAYQEADIILKNDKEASQLLADFQEAQQTLQVFQQGNFPGVQEQHQKVQDLYRKVQNNQIIMNWAKSQNKMQTLVGDLATDLTNQIKFFFAPPQKGGCCG